MHQLLSLEQVVEEFVKQVKIDPDFKNSDDDTILRQAKVYFGQYFGICYNDLPRVFRMMTIKEFMENHYNTVTTNDRLESIDSSIDHLIISLNKR